MSWPAFVATAWGAGCLLALSGLLRPARWIVRRPLELVDAKVSPGRPWLASGPDCPACVAFWAAVVLVELGHGPPGVPPGVAVLVAYGVCLTLTGAWRRLTAGLDV